MDPAPRMTAPEAILFDLDGTLADSLPSLAAITNAVLRARSREEQPVSRLRLFVGDGPAKLVERALEATGGASAQEASDAVAEFMALYEASPVEGTVLYPGAAACLDALSGAGIRLGICTNKPEAVSRLLVGGLGLLDRFGALVGGDSCAVRKPAAEPALEACRRLGVDPARTWFVGDSEHDVACGRSAGCAATILVTYGYLRVPVEEIEADALAGDLGEVARLALSASG